MEVTALLDLQQHLVHGATELQEVTDAGTELRDLLCARV